MRNLPYITLAGLLILTSVDAQDDIAAKFEFRSHTFQGTTIPYRLFVPEQYDSAQVYPMALALHGSGERGSDNSVHVRTWRLATAWADPVNQTNYPCFVVAPQCPHGRAWTYAGRSSAGDRPRDPAGGGQVHILSALNQAGRPTPASYCSGSRGTPTGLLR